MVSVLEDFKKIIDYAIWAPSGDNSQPWRFEVADNEIRVFNVPEKDTSLYNFNQNASLVALGGLIENVKITALHYGYNPLIELFPQGSNSDLVAMLSFNETARFDDPLYPSIKERVSNRKPYATRILPTDYKQELLRAADLFTGVSIKLVDGREEIEKLAKAASVNEKVVLENKKLHEFLFSHITWSEKEDASKRGFFIKTLELKGPQVAGFKLFRHWKILTLFNKIGASNLVSRDNTKLYKQSGAFVAIIADDSSAKAFLKSGMLMQRFWLGATKLSLGVQPLTGVLFLYHRVKSRDDYELRRDHSVLVRSAYSVIEDVFKTNGESITMMFRVGYADRPNAKCLRQEPTVKFLKHA